MEFHEEWKQRRQAAAYHPGEVTWEENGCTVTRTTHWSAPGCHDGCAVLLHVKDGKLVKVEGDPASPYNKGRLCMRCLAMPSYVNDDSRVKWPLRRAGKRGENKWERVSWDEALDDIAARWRAYVDEFGYECVLRANGTGRNAFWQTRAIASTALGGFASGGVLSGDTCYVPRVQAMNNLIGGPMVADCAQMYEASFDHPEWRAPDYMIVWGCNPMKTNADGFYGHWVIDLMKQGTRFITVDPDLTWIAAHSDYHLAIRPGTDAALALAMIDTICKEGLENREFVNKWCFGFDELAGRAAEYPAEKVAEICGVNAKDIHEAARAFARSESASIQWGVSVDMHTHGVATAHAILALWSICGFVDIPGGNIFPSEGYTTADCSAAFGQFTLPEQRPTPETMWKFLGAQDYPMRRGQSAWDRGLETLETGEPFQFKMGFFGQTNTFVCSAAESQRVLDALNNIEFIIVADPYLTPTAVALADYVLPTAMSCERDSFREWWAPLRAIKKVTSYYEAKSDDEILLELGKRTRPDVFNQWADTREMLDWLINKRNRGKCEYRTFDELVAMGYEYAPFEYRKHEKGLLREDGMEGFNTPTGLIELYSTIFEYFGLDPLPYYREPRESPVSTPELAKEFPFVLTTGRRAYEFFHSEHRQLGPMRDFHPDPIVRINTQDACDLGIENGDWVWLENVHGKCKQRAEVDGGMKQGVVSAEHGWWFPEREAAAPSLYGSLESNANQLTTQCDIGPSGYGAPYKCQICKVYKVTESNDTLERTEAETQRGIAARLYARPENCK